MLIGRYNPIKTIKQKETIRLNKHPLNIFIFINVLSINLNLNIADTSFFLINHPIKNIIKNIKVEIPNTKIIPLYTISKFPPSGFFKVNNNCTSEKYSRQMKSLEMLLCEVLKGLYRLKSTTSIKLIFIGEKVATES